MRRADEGERWRLREAVAALRWHGRACRGYECSPDYYRGSKGEGRRLRGEEWRGEERERVTKAMGGRIMKPPMRRKSH